MHCIDLSAWKYLLGKNSHEYVHYQLLGSYEKCRKPQRASEIISVAAKKKQGIRRAMEPPQIYLKGELENIGSGNFLGEGGLDVQA